MSMYVEFDNSLVTGNDVIDAQHKEWIDKINALLECCEKTSGKREALKMLEYMAEYAEFHFVEEEKLQEEVGYPGLEEHKEKHEGFKKAVDELHEMLEDEEGPSQKFVDALNANVVNWVYDHIKTFDCSVATYIHMNGHPERL